MNVTDTSLAAYDSIAGQLSEKRKAVLTALKQLEPASNAHVAEFLHWPINCVTGRMNELRKLGFVRPRGKKPGPPTGRFVYYWETIKHS
jgi:predicted transcriptional regulator